jgi:hypothetical protein
MPHRIFQLKFSMGVWTLARLARKCASTYLQPSSFDQELSVPTLRQLDYLVAIAETRHFSRAARRVHTTQSTLSLQLKALEGRLGVLLVDRSARSVTLTDTGHEVVDIARRILRDAQLIHELARAKRADRLKA